MELFWSKSDLMNNLKSLYRIRVQKVLGQVNKGIPRNKFCEAFLKNCPCILFDKFSTSLMMFDRVFLLREADRAEENQIFAQYFHMLHCSLTTFFKLCLLNCWQAKENQIFAPSTILNNSVDSKTNFWGEKNVKTILKACFSLFVFSISVTVWWN